MCDNIGSSINYTIITSINVYRLPNMNYLLKYSNHYSSPHI